MAARPPGNRIDIRRMGAADADAVIAAGVVFDRPPRREWTGAFLAADTHHLLIAYVGDEPAGFVSGIEIHHPDTGAEMLLYELGVEEPFRRRGIGRALTERLRHLAVERGCRGMWAPTEIENEAAIATYRAAGADPPEPGVIMSWTFEEAPGNGP